MRSRLFTLTAATTLLATACSAMAPRATRMTSVAGGPPPPPPPMPAEVAAELAPPPAPAPGPVAAPPAIAVATPTPVAVVAPESSTGDTHAAAAPNPWVETARDHLSTFAADVDTASYTYSRRALDGGALPPAAAVRVEEFVNAFKYRFGAPTAGSPFAVVMDAAPSPFDARHHVVRVGVATPGKALSQRAPMNLVFLVDVAGSMDQPDKLGLAKQALRELVAALGPADSVALVTYAGSTEVVLPAVSGAEHRQLLAAIDRLRADGSTAMGSGLELAYQQARARLSAKAASRVIVLSDGDANVGPSSLDEMLRIIDRGRQDGVTLSTIGFGMGNYRAELMEQLGDRGNGNNYYVDSAAAARKLFTTDLVAMLEVAAKDVKLQVDFDPAMVARYRLLGYENRAIADADFRVDSVDAGEVGVGHQVTALYEVALTARASQTTPLGAVRIRYKAPRAGDADAAREATFAMASGPAATFASAPADLRFATAVAGFADVLRGAEDAQRWSLAQIAEVARATAGGDADRRELVGLIEAARRLRGAPAALVAR
ncbi:MAG: von Willebrand factor type A domain-containing protein [Kofleriaceae bacterium]|nr:von Willebrand factor type A domain-containing protein [Kofleriaceae bacterium]